MIWGQPPPAVRPPAGRLGSRVEGIQCSDGGRRGVEARIHGSSGNKQSPFGRWTAEACPELVEGGGCPHTRINSSRASYCPRINGNPFLLFPITTTFVLALLARFSVASIPFHSSSDGVMPWARFSGNRARP